MSKPLSGLIVTKIWKPWTNQGSSFSCCIWLIFTIFTFGEVSESWDKGYKVKKNMADFFLKSSLVYLGTSPDTIGKISWPLKEAILEASTFSLNLLKSDLKLLEALETSILIQYASVIPFRKPLDVLMKLCTIWLTSEAIRGC